MGEINNSHIEGRVDFLFRISNKTNMILMAEQTGFPFALS